MIPSPIKRKRGRPRKERPPVPTTIPRACVGPMERAFQRAESGQFDGIIPLKAALKAEGYVGLNPRDPDKWFGKRARMAIIRLCRHAYAEE